MASRNLVILLGRLGKDPEIRYTPSGTAVANFSMATEESFKDKSGEKQNSTTWHNIVAWARLAEICGEYLKKGGLVYIEGRLQTRSWDDRDGNKKYITEIVAQSMQMLGGKTSDKPAKKENEPPAYDPSSIPDDDIPF